MKAFRPRDLILTKENLWFAVADYRHPPGRVNAFLRYVPSGGSYRKVRFVSESFRFLERKFPKYLMDERRYGIRLQAVPCGRIRDVVTPRGALAAAFGRGGGNAVPEACVLARLLSQESGVSLRQLGITGSLAAGAGNKASDIDIVTYGLHNFKLVRLAAGRLLGEGVIAPLSDSIIRKAYHSKGYPGIFKYDEFRAGMLNKHNSFMFRGRKADLMCVRLRREIGGCRMQHSRQLAGRLTVKAMVTDDALAFDSPAVYKIKSGNHPQIREVVSYRNAYAGQAVKGDAVIVSGALEEVREHGGKPWQRLVVGTMREREEYIRRLPKAG
ncbi:MAG: hypothetical protein PHG85_02020 [Candidatus Altiarchaeota archaeon]|nr:hypothetical protein [Candidatus Altiarchaeota archaeon]